VGGKAFFAGGEGPGLHSNVVDIYDANSDNWSSATLSVGRELLVCASSGTKILFAGGLTSSGPSKVVDVYDVNTKQWTTANLSSARYNLAAASVGTKVFFAGGDVASVFTNVVDIYDVNTNAWTTATLSQARSQIIATTIGTKVFFAGGSPGPSAVVDIYDNSNGSWTTTTLPAPLMGGAAITVGDYALFAGDYSDAVHVYNNQTGSWSTTHLSQRRMEMAATAVGDKALFAGGYDFTLYPTAYYDVVDIFSGSCITPSVSVTPASEICKGSSINLAANGAGTYAWSPSTGLSAVVGKQVTANPDVTTTYTVIGTVASNCTNTAQVTVTVKELPDITVTPSGKICNGESMSLLATGAVDYSWSPMAGLSSASGSSVVAAPTENVTYTVSGKAANNCEATKTVTVTVNPKPLIDVSASSEICKGSSVALSASGPASFSWLPSKGLSSKTGNEVMASPDVTTTYLVTGTDNNNCSNTGEITVKVKDLPKVTLTAPSKICIGESASITASGAQNYTWSPSIGLSSTTGASVTASPTVTTIFSVLAKGSNNCEAVEKLTLTVNPKPVLVITASTEICKGASVTISASGASTYSWLPSASLSSATGAEVKASPDVTTTYSVTGTSNENCSTTTTITLTVTDKPEKPTIDANFLPSGLFLLVSSSGNGNRWYRNNEQIVDAVNQVFPVIAVGAYSVTVTKQGCEGPMSEPFVITNIKSVLTESDITLSPNPTTHILNINNHSFDLNSAIQIQIIDVLGNVVLQSERWPEGGNFDISMLLSGHYFFQVTQDQKIITKRFIKW
jgi:hypothetical protein